MNKLAIFVLIFLAILIYLNRQPINNTTNGCKEVWIGGPASHVPKPMARWEYN